MNNSQYFFKWLIMINIQNLYVFSVHNLMSLEISIYLWQGCCSFTRLCPTLCDPMNCSTPGFSVLPYLLEFVQTPGHWISDAIQPFHPLMPPSPLTSILPSIRVFSSESTLHIRWPKYWSFSFSISPTNEYSGLIFFRIDWFDLLAVQGTLKSVLHYHSLKASIFWHSAFLHIYMTTVMEWEMTTYSSILASKVPWTEEPGRLQSMGVTKNWTWLSKHAHTHSSVKSSPWSITIFSKESSYPKAVLKYNADISYIFFYCMWTCVHTVYSYYLVLWDNLLPDVLKTKTNSKSRDKSNEWFQKVAYWFNEPVSTFINYICAMFSKFWVWS